MASTNFTRYLIIAHLVYDRASHRSTSYKPSTAACLRVHYKTHLISTTWQPVSHRPWRRDLGSLLMTTDTYRVAQKSKPQSFVHIFVKYW